MSDFFAIPTVQTVFSVLVLGILIAAGVWLVSIFRDRIDDDRESTPELLSNFEEMAREGDISESEFRTIEAVMGENLSSDVEQSGTSDSS